eukprot:scaffold275861_cov27-Tisochrysis_lutea.AAC.2
METSNEQADSVAQAGSGSGWPFVQSVGESARCVSLRGTRPPAMLGRVQFTPALSSTSPRRDATAHCVSRIAVAPENEASLARHPGHQAPRET